MIREKSFRHKVVERNNTWLDDGGRSWRAERVRSSRKTFNVYVSRIEREEDVVTERHFIDFVHDQVDDYYEMSIDWWYDWLKEQGLPLPEWYVD